MGSAYNIKKQLKIDDITWDAIEVLAIKKGVAPYEVVNKILRNNKEVNDILEAFEAEKEVGGVFAVPGPHSRQLRRT